SDPARELTLHGYEAASGQPITAPLPLQRFADYGRWFQSRAVPDVDCRTVDRLDRSEQGFQLTLADGESYRARRVIVAAGIASFAWYPPVFRRLPSALASHTCEHRDLGGFSGKKLAVVGAGQSALESAALLSETGVDVEVLIRASSVRWLWPRKGLRIFPPVERLLYAPPDVGQAGISHLVARPNLFRHLPRSLQDRLRRRAIRPAGPARLKPRCERLR